MLLMNYKMNASNAESFADALKSIVPGTLKKMAMIDNHLTDDQISRMFKSLGSNQLGGLSSLCLMKNEMGNETIQSLAHSFLPSDAARVLKKLFIKKPILVSRKLQMEDVFVELERHALNFRVLDTLCISQLKLGRGCISPLAIAI
jgi:hypothetical protein